MYSSNPERAMWTAILGPIGDIIDKVITDKAQAAAAKASLTQLAAQGQLQEQLLQLTATTKAQSDIDQAEAAQPGMHFRDGAGWVCVAGFALSVLKSPIEWACSLAGHPVTLPAMDA